MKITARSNQREEMIDITRQVEEAVADGDGVVVCFVQHTTCGLTVNENADPDVQKDMLAWLRYLVPQFPGEPTTAHAGENHPVDEASPPLLRKEGSFTTPSAEAASNPRSGLRAGQCCGRPATAKGGEPVFRHFEHNSDAHIKSSLMGTSVTVPFEDGRLCLGRWQGIYLCEFDGPRERTVLVKGIRGTNDE